MCRLGALDEARHQADQQAPARLDTTATPPAGDASFARAYRGHKNTMTLKDVAIMGDGLGAFSGGMGGYVLSGSDDGHIFVWEAATGRLVRLLPALEQGLANCLAVGVARAGDGISCAGARTDGFGILRTLRATALSYKAAGGMLGGRHAQQSCCACTCACRTTGQHLPRCPAVHPDPYNYQLPTTGPAMAKV